jgi:hypothetical protein
MFKSKGRSHAISTNGFEVSFRGRDDLAYAEHVSDGTRRTVTVFAQMELGRVDRVISVGRHFPQHYDPPHEQEPIGHDRKEQMIKNITDALDFLGITYEQCE